MEMSSSLVANRFPPHLRPPKSPRSLKPAIRKRCGKWPSRVKMHTGVTVYRASTPAWRGCN